MKKLITILLFICLFFIQNLFAQRAYVMWELTLDLSVTTLIGEVTANDVSLQGGLTVRDFTGSQFGPAVKIWYKDGAEWPNETAPSFDKYVEFKVSPKPGNNLIVDTVKYGMGSYGTRAYMHANVYWDRDPSFANKKIIDTTSAPINDIRDSAAYVRVHKIGEKILDGQSFIMRIYPWYSTTGGTTKYFCLNYVEVIGKTETAVSVDEESNLPVEFELEQNYPNPFNPATTISFTIPKSSYVNLSVYNSLGEKVATLISREMEAGYHSVLLDASNLTSGVYFYKLETENYIGVKKMVLAK
ncbi:MAG: T9SS type A sorting domain-containing protein [Melioribacteraceae bacterium]